MTKKKTADLLSVLALTGAMAENLLPPTPKHRPIHLRERAEKSERTEEDRAARRAQKKKLAMKRRQRRKKGQR